MRKLIKYQKIVREGDYETIEILFNQDYQELDPHGHRLEEFTEEGHGSALFEKCYGDIKIEVLINGYYLITPKVLIFKNKSCVYNEYMTPRDLDIIIKKLNRDFIIDSLD